MVETSAAPREFEFTIGEAIAAPDVFGDSFVDLAARAEGELAPDPEGDPAVAFRRTLGMFATGVTVLTTTIGEQVYGMTANAFMSVSLEPPLVLVSIDRRARLCALLDEGTQFGVSVLEASQALYSDYFARRADVPEEPRFELVRDTPLLDGALAHLVARVVRCYWGGDHVLFLGEVEYARRGEGEPLLFHGGRYERLVRDARVLSSLPRELLDPILAVGEEREYEDGATIMRIGEAGAELLLVLEGAVSVVRPRGRSLTLGPGELVGEVEVLDPGGGRIAEVHAVGRTRCVAVSRGQLLEALRADPRAAVALIEMLAARFRETSRA